MSRDHVPHAGLSSDEEFLRRAYLDATGRIPSVDDVQSFLVSKDPDKRDKLIDRLVTSDAFVDRWAFYFEDLFRVGGRMGRASTYSISGSVNGFRWIALITR